MNGQPGKYAIPCTHAKVVLRNGKSYGSAVIEFKTPAEADLRIRNMAPTDTVRFDVRRHVRVQDRPVWDPEAERWLDGVRVEHDWHEVTAADIESVSEAI